MSKVIEVARINSTGALIRLHEGNQTILKRAGVTRTQAKADKETGRLIEVGGYDSALVAATSADVQRIGEALVNNKEMRATLLASALALPGSESYLRTIGVFDDSDVVEQNVTQADLGDSDGGTGSGERTDKTGTKGKGKSKGADANLNEI